MRIHRGSSRLALPTCRQTDEAMQDLRKVDGHIRLLISRRDKYIAAIREWGDKGYTATSKYHENHFLCPTINILCGAKSVKQGIMDRIMGRA